MFVFFFLALELFHLACVFSEYFYFIFRGIFKMIETSYSSLSVIIMTLLNCVTLVTASNLPFMFLSMNL